MLMPSKEKQPSIRAQVSNCNNASLLPFQAADPKIEEQARCKAHHSTKPFGCFVHDRRHVLRRCKRMFRNDKDYCTFFLYRVVTLVAKTPFLMLLVAR
jgi:hypothetical protein